MNADEFIATKAAFRIEEVGVRWLSEVGFQRCYNNEGMSAQVDLTSPGLLGSIRSIAIDNPAVQHHQGSALDLPMDLDPQQQSIGWIYSAEYVSK